MDATPSTSEGTGVASPTESIAFAPPAAVPSTSKGKKATKRVLGADDEDEDGKQKKRNRKPVTCAQCRRRKLKCDRGYPCGACRDRQEGHLCEWEGAIRLPQPHLTRDAEAQELRGQLDRFENLLTALSTGQSIVPSALGGANGASGSGEGDVGENGAAHLLSHLSANTANSSAVKISNSAARAQLLAQAQSVGHLVGLLPSRKELDILVLRFVSGEPNFLPVIHVPTFQKRYNDFSHSTATEEPFFLAFLFSIVSYEMGWQLGEMSLSKTAGVQKEGAMKRLFEASSEALRMAGYLESPNLDVVRTLIVLYHCASQQLDARAGHLLTQAIQVAQSLGLNRDPQAAGITDQVQIQERRRLWYILVAYDSLEQPGRLSMISPERYDTLQAASAFDNDITETSVTTRPFPSFTPALYLNLLNDIANYNRLITQSFFSIKPKEQITWAKIVESNAGIDRLRESFSPLTWKNGLVEPLPEDQFSSDKFRVLAHTALLKLDIRVNRPFLTRGFADSRFKEGRTRTLDAAHQLLGIWLAYPDQSSVSRLWQLSYHGLNALCIIIVDLLQDPKGPRADSHRKFLAMSSGRLDRPEFKSKLSLAVTRVIGILTQHLGTPILPAHIASSTTLDPSESFAVSSLPLPLTIDPFAYISPSPSSEDRDPTLATAWHEIVDSYPAMYAVPDKYEWMELSKLENRWRDGIDLLVDQSIDQLEEE